MRMQNQTDQLIAMLGGQPVIPVLSIEDADKAVPLARALARGGLSVIEITLRTAAALESIRRAAAEVSDAVIGAGTILDAEQYAAACDAGARFIVSPGLTRSLVETARGSTVPLLGGASTPSEIMAAREAGFTFLKFFPAEQAGGAAYLKALASPLSGMSFCPTGGITQATARSYLDLPNVRCIGGSWVAPADLVAAGRWDEIEALARDVSRLAQAR